MTAKLLLNENFPIPAITFLRNQGHDLIAIKETHADLSDIEVLALTVLERRWIFTFDRDYGELVFRRQMTPQPTNVLLRETHDGPSDSGRWVIEMLQTPERFEGKFVVFSRGDIRTCPLFQVL